MTPSRVLVSVVLVIASLLPSAAESGDVAQLRQLFADANEAYEAGQFGQAADGYERCIGAGADGADVLYNLGNAYARQRQLGNALAAYERALTRAPRDRHIRENIEQVATQRVEAAPRVPRSWFLGVGEGLLKRHTLTEFVVVCGLLALLVTALALRLLLGAGASRRLWAASATAGATFVICLTLCLAKYSAEWGHPGAYINVEQVTVRSGPGDHFEVTGQLTDGARVEPERRSGLWTEVRLPTGAHAWTQEANLSRVNPAAGP